MGEYRPWITTISEITDIIYETPKDTIWSFWARLRKELKQTCQLKEFRKTGGGEDLNQKGWRLGLTGYVQQLKMRAQDDENVEERLVEVTAICHAYWKAKNYPVFLLFCVNQKIVSRISGSSCQCVSGKEQGLNAFCKHILALIVALKSVIDGGPIPEWPRIVTNQEQTWHKKGSAFMLWRLSIYQRERQLSPDVDSVPNRRLCMACQ